MSPPLSFRGSNAKGAQLTPKEQVKAIVEPPNPIIQLKFSHSTKHSATLREVAKACRHNNWGCWQYDGDTTWSTIHKDSTPEAPRLNCDPVAAVTVSKPLFEASPACKAFTVETPMILCTKTILSNAVEPLIVKVRHVRLNPYSRAT